MPAITFFKTFTKPNGYLKTEYLYSYAAVLCKKGGTDVMAVKMDGYARKTDLYDDIKANWPDYKVKAIHKLYTEDFEEDQS